MPRIYNCPDCNLTFTLGWCHDVRVNGIGSTTYLVCIKCGTQHEVTQEMGANWPEYYEKWDVTILSAPPNARESLKKELCRYLAIGFERALRIIDNLPFVIERNIPDSEAAQLQYRFEKAGAVVQMQSIEKIRNEEFRPPGQDRLFGRIASPRFPDETPKPDALQEIPIKGPREGPTGHFNLSLQSCGCCGAIGTLVAELPDTENNCPLCGNARLQLQGEWIT